MKNLLFYADARRVANAAAAGVTDVNGASVDTQGYLAAYAVASLGALTAGQQTRLICEQSSDNGVADPWTQIGATNLAADADSNKLLILEINEPTKRHLRFTVKRSGANAVVDSVVVYLHRANLTPVPQNVTVSDRKLFSSPS